MAGLKSMVRRECEDDAEHLKRGEILVEATMPDIDVGSANRHSPK